MGLDEAFFGKFYKAWKNKFNPDPIDPPYTVYLKEITLRLEILASALCGQKISIFPCRDLGGLIGSDLYLPEKISQYADPQMNLSAYLCHVIYSAETNQEITPFAESAMPEELTNFTTKNLKLFLQKLNQKYPAFENISKNFREPLFLEAFGYPPRTKNSSAAGSEDDPMLNTPSKGQEIKGKTAPKAELKKTEEKDENPLVHTFEKVHTLEEYHGGSKRTDGANEMEEHEEALKELELKYVIRSPEQTDSVFKSNAIVEAQETILKDPLDLPAGKIFKYPEWNEKEKGYRQNWVTLHEYELPALPKATAIQSLAVKNLKRKWELLVNEMHWQKKCKDGFEIDLNAYLTDWIGWQKNGQELTRIYEQKIKLNRDVAIGVLIDLSLSTDSYVNGERVFDLVTGSLEIFAHCMDQFIEQVSLGGFFSETRQKVSYLNLKDFKEPFSRYQSRTGWLKPTGYTRLGAPLRHMHEKLKKVKARKKWLFLISDAKPTDYDHYEGSYGMADLRTAVGELKQSDINHHIFTVTEEKNKRFEYLFGRGHFSYLKNQQDFIRELSKLILTLVK